MAQDGPDRCSQAGIGCSPIFLEVLEQAQAIEISAPEPIRGTFPEKVAAFERTLLL